MAFFSIRIDLDGALEPEEGLGESLHEEAIPYLRCLIEIGLRYGADLQFCASGRTVEAYQTAVCTLLDYGFPVEPKLYHPSAKVHDRLSVVEKEYKRSLRVFKESCLIPSGFAAPDMNPEGVLPLGRFRIWLQESGLCWACSRYDPSQPLEALQPVQLPGDLWEFPVTGFCDLDFFLRREQYPEFPWELYSPQIRDYIVYTLGWLQRASEVDCACIFWVHLGVLARYDPRCVWIREILPEAQRLGMTYINFREWAGLKPLYAE